ncbi:MAG: hypothetical protein IPF99_08565 [Deltaproteobacteria bacterium]|nr:hypothetical protein [Deltaproteobacteria bacterium]
MVGSSSRVASPTRRTPAWQRSQGTPCAAWRAWEKRRLAAGISARATRSGVSARQPSWQRSHPPSGLVAAEDGCSRSMAWQGAHEASVGSRLSSTRALVTAAGWQLAQVTRGIARCRE